MDGNREQNDPPHRRSESQPEDKSQNSNIDEEIREMRMLIQQMQLNQSKYATKEDVESLEQEIRRLNHELDLRRNEIQNLTHNLRQREEEIKELREQARLRDEESKRKDEEIKRKDEEIKELKEKDKRKDEVIRKKEQELVELRRKIASEQAKIKEMKSDQSRKIVMQFRAAFTAYIFEVRRSYDSLGIPTDPVIEQLQRIMGTRDANYVTNVEHLNYLVNRIPGEYEEFTDSIRRVAEIWKDLHDQGKLDRDKWRRNN